MCAPSAFAKETSAVLCRGLFGDLLPDSCQGAIRDCCSVCGIDPKTERMMSLLRPMVDAFRCSDWITTTVALALRPPVCNMD